jgi:eukaryotic-like serine/threonine-protein kinase
VTSALFPTEVRDENGVTLRLAELLGRPGGQGSVHRVEGDPEVAVKLLRKVPARPLRTVRRLPLHEVAIAAPTRLLAERDGYLMDLASGMAPLEDLLPRPRPGFGAKHDLEWYRETGGLRRRLRILARTAEVISTLHGLSLVYADLNPGNIMVSISAALDQVLLIDADNLELSSNVRTNVYTPGFVAPERARGLSGPTTLSDAYTFGLMAFSLLSMKYPFEGEAIANATGDEVDEARDRGELAFVDDVSDRSNSSTPGGLPRSYVLSAVLQGLAQACLGDGRLDPARRPSAGAWRDALWRAADNAVACGACGWSYFRNLGACPVCNAPRPALLGITVRRVEGGPITWQMVVPRGTTGELDERVVFGDHGNGRVADIRVQGTEIRLDLDERFTVEVVSGPTAWRSGSRAQARHLRNGESVRLAVNGGGRAQRLLDLHWIAT